MSDTGDITLSDWVVGSVAAGFLTLVGFLSKFVFAGVFKRLDEIKLENDEANKAQLSEIRHISSIVGTHTTALALVEMRVARLESLQVKVDDLVGFLQSQGFRKRDGHTP